MAREQFALRTDDQVAYGRMVATGAGIGFLAEAIPVELARAPEPGP